MISISETNLTTVAEIAVGSLALGFGYGHQGMPFLINQEDGEKGLFRLRDQFFTVQEDHRTSLLALGAPVARFDPTSAIADEKAPDDGTLVITTKGAGIYESSSSIRTRGGFLTLLSGEKAPFYRLRDSPAFSRWEIGYMRDQEFVQVAGIEARQGRFNA